MHCFVISMRHTCFDISHVQGTLPFLKPVPIWESSHHIAKCFLLLWEADWSLLVGCGDVLIPSFHLFEFFIFRIFSIWVLSSFLDHDWLFNNNYFSHWLWLWHFYSLFFIYIFFALLVFLFLFLVVVYNRLLDIFILFFEFDCILFFACFITLYYLYFFYHSSRSRRNNNNNLILLFLFLNCRLWNHFFAFT